MSPFPLRRTSSAQVHIVKVNLDQYPSNIQTLSAGELDRYQRLIVARDRYRYLAAHSALRTILASVLGVPAGTLVFGTNGRKKPVLTTRSDIDIRFNLSHSKDLALIALSLGREVGVDIEAVRDLEVDAIASCCFSPAEREVLNRVEGTEARLSAFYRCWTRKESFVKAIGEGLFCPLDAFDVSLEATPMQALLASRLAGVRGVWTIRNATGAPGFAAAITVEGDGCSVEEWNSPDDFLRGNRLVTDSRAPQLNIRASETEAPQSFPIQAAYPKPLPMKDQATFSAHHEKSSVGDRLAAHTKANERSFKDVS